MTFEELEHTEDWSNEEYFDYMKESGNWMVHENLGHTGKPCDRCEKDDLGSWKIEAYVDVEESCSRRYSTGTEFKICLMCMLELYGATYPDKEARP